MEKQRESALTGLRSVTESRRRVFVRGVSLGLERGSKKWLFAGIAKSREQSALSCVTGNKGAELNEGGCSLSVRRMFLFPSSVRL